MKILKHLLVLIVLVNLAIHSCAQANKRPFEDQIEAFKESDKDDAPPKHGILFVGSSSIRLWKGLEKDFAGYPVINRGFGGSGLDHATMYADEIIVLYEPKQVVIYSGENDIAGGKVTAGDMIYRFKRLFSKIRKALPNTHVVYISMKPSPSREKFRPVIEESNRLIREFLAQQPQTAYVDIFPLMLGPDGKPRRELYVDDELHMSRKGYEIWKAAVKPHLLK